MRKAKELLFTGDSITAEEAKQLGFVNHVVPRKELETFTLGMAARIANMPPTVLRFAKLSLNRILDNMGQANSFWQYYAVHQLTHQTKEFKDLRDELRARQGDKGGLKDFIKERDKNFA